jgi:hypothetical protein
MANYSGRDRLAQAIMGFNPAGRAGRAAPVAAPVSGFGWNGLPPPEPPAAFNAPPPGVEINPAVFGGQPYGRAGIESTGGYPSGLPAAPTGPGVAGTNPSTSYPIAPGGVSATPTPETFGGRPYGLDAIAASGGYPSSSEPGATPGYGTPLPFSDPNTGFARAPSFGVPPGGTEPQFIPNDVSRTPAGPDYGSFDWSVYGLGPGGAPIPTPPAQFDSTGRRIDDDGLGPDFGPGPGPGPGPDPDPDLTGGPPTGEPGDRGSPPTGDRGDRDRGDRDAPPPPTGVPDLPPPIEIVDYPVVGAPNDQPPVGLGGPPTEVPPGFGLDPRDFEDRFGFGPPGMDPAPPFDYGVPGFGPGQTPAVGPDNPYQSYGSADPPYGSAEPIVDIELAADQPGDFYDYGDLDEDVDAGDYGGDDEE